MQVYFCFFSVFVEAAALVLYKLVHWLKLEGFILALDLNFQFFREPVETVDSNYSQSF